MRKFLRAALAVATLLTAACNAPKTGETIYLADYLT